MGSGPLNPHALVAGRFLNRISGLLAVAEFADLTHPEFAAQPDAALVQSQVNPNPGTVYLIEHYVF